MLRLIALPLLLCIFAPSFASEEISLSLESLSAAGLQLEGLHVVLDAPPNKPRSLQLTVNKIKLPAPFEMLSFFELRCAEFSLQDGAVSCTGGQAKIVSPWLDDAAANIRFQASKGKTELQLEQVKFAGGSLNLSLNYAQGRWRCKLNARQLQAGTLQRLAALKAITVSAGTLDIDAAAQGRGIDIDALQAELRMRGLNAQSEDGKYAAENLQVNAQLQGRITPKLWQWRTQLQLRQGAVYGEPVYIALDRQALEIQGRSEWLPQTRQLRVDEVRLLHAGVGQAEGHALFRGGTLQDAAVALQTSATDKFSEVYLQPFLTATVWEGLSLSGQLRARAEISGASLARLEMQFPQLQLADTKQRFALQNAAGALYWAKNAPPGASHLRWKGLRFYGLQFGPADLAFSAYNGELRLNRPLNLPLFDGELRIARFSWKGRPGAEPEVHFQGDIEQVSLQKLTDALHWPPLSGQLSGNIPGVHYRDRQLGIDGALQIRLFGGEVRIEDVQVSGLLGDFPRFRADVEIDNLDLDQITRRFPFGGMQGRLSGSIRGLALENWQPVVFDAWLGTPEGDDSTHRISQKAVNSLASIGGGGATDFVSRSILRMFDNFGYERLGIGCSLQRGVCQLTGVGTAQQGFYIVKGGGLPRIDVIGYNSSIDWQILLQRLRRVLATDKAIVQ